MKRHLTTRSAGIHGLMHDRQVEEVALLPGPKTDQTHRFRWWCLFVVLAGEGRMRYGRCPWQACPVGSVVQAQAGRSLAFGSASQAFTCGYVSFSGTGIDVLARQGVVPTVGQVHAGADVPLVIDQLYHIHRQLARADARGQDAAWLTLNGLLLDLIDTHTEVPLPAVTALIAELSRHPERDLDLAGWSRSHGISLAHLRASFTRATGHPPARFQAHRRCDRARRLLLESDLSIQEVGAAIGLPHPVSFARFFRRLTGCTPSAYRVDGSGMVWATPVGR